VMYKKISEEKEAKDEGEEENPEFDSDNGFWRY
jgi:hypothetical protein